MLLDHNSRHCNRSVEVDSEVDDKDEEVVDGADDVNGGDYKITNIPATDSRGYPFVSISQVFDSLVGLFGLVLFHLLCLFVSLIALYSVSPYHSAHTRKYLNFYGILSNVAVDANLVNSVHQIHESVFVTGPDSNGFAFLTPFHPAI